MTDNEIANILEPIRKEIYKEFFKDAVKIRIVKQKDHNLKNKFAALDKDKGVDTILKLKDDSMIFIQEKTRRKSYGDLTEEYMNNPETGEKGEYFHLYADYYFYGFANGDFTDYDFAYILNVPKLKEYWNTIDIESRLKQNYKENGKANFFYYNPPANCIEYIYRGGIK